jgi:hypothetical protein
MRGNRSITFSGQRIKTIGDEEPPILKMPLQSEQQGCRVAVAQRAGHRRNPGKCQQPPPDARQLFGSGSRRRKQEPQDGDAADRAREQGERPSNELELRQVELGEARQHQAAENDEPEREGRLAEEKRAECAARREDGERCVTRPAMTPPNAASAVAAKTTRSVAIPLCVSAIRTINTPRTQAT